MRSSKIILIPFLFCLSTECFSQKYHSFHFGVALPMADFASDDALDADAGGAAPGLSLGFKFVESFGNSGIGIYWGMDANYNRLQKDIRESVQQFYDNLGFSDVEINFYEYWTFPLSSGLNFAVKMDEDVSFFSNGGFLLNFLKVTDMSINTGGSEGRSEADLTTSFGFRLGGGFIFNNNVSMAIDYMGMGKHELRVSSEGPGSSFSVDEKLKVDILAVTLGVMF